MMFDINDFSGINIRYGSDIGDKLLSSTAERIKDVFEDGSVYRTGSDEFVAVVKTDNTPDSLSNIAGLLERACKSLTSDHNLGNRNVSAGYSAALVKINGPSTADMSVHNQLKQTMTSGKLSASGNWRYTEV